MIEFLRWLPPVAHGLAAGLYLARFLRDPDSPGGSSAWASTLAVVLHSLVLAGIGAAQGRLPVASMGELLSFSALVLAASYLAVERLGRTEALGVFFLAPVTLASAISASIPVSPYWPEHLQTPLFALHASLGATALSCLFTSALLGGAYLLQYRQLERRQFGVLSRRLPDLPTLDRLFLLCGVFGTVLLVCSVVAGGVWMAQWQLPLRDATLKSALVGATVAWYSGLALLRSRTAFTARTSARLAMLGGILVVLVLFAGTHG
jgi:ABC-type uncharacterized transport system permease subunit